jgi:predicted dehydrogenase
MNQAPHNLDLICHLMGMPRQVIAWTRTHLHNIETEDTAQAMLEWPSGAIGTIHVSTAEAGQPQRLEIIGTQGCLRIQREQVTFHQFDEDLREFIPRSHEPYMPPASHPVTIELKPGGGDHVSIYRNLHEAILKGKSLIADGVNGRMSLELANAMTFSSHTRREVELPLDRHTYASMLKDLKSRARDASSAQGR